MVLGSLRWKPFGGHQVVPCGLGWRPLGGHKVVLGNLGSRPLLASKSLTLQGLDHLVAIKWIFLLKNHLTLDCKEPLGGLVTSGLFFWPKDDLVAIKCFPP